MKATFIETVGFTERVEDFLTDIEYSKLQKSLMEDPEAGDVMTGCAGLRKVRAGDARRGKGKRGGVRVIYLHIPAARRFYMIDVYGKNEKDDLSSHEKKALRQLVEELKRVALTAHESQRKDG